MSIRIRIAIALCSLTLVAAAGEAKGKNVGMKVVQVNDRRSTGSFAQLSVVVELSGVRSSEVAASRVLLTSATDDLGTSLIKSDEGEPSLEQNTSSLYSKDAGERPARVSVTLGTPARKAKLLTDLRGEVELYMPSLDPNGTASIPRFMSLSGRPMTHKALKANGISISLVSPAQLEADKKSAAEKKKAELKGEGTPEEDIADAISNFLENLFTPDDGDVVLKVSDPNKRIESVAYVDATGTKKPVMMREHEGLTVLSTWGEKPAADWALQVNMKSAKSLVRYPLALQNVPLP